MSKFVLLHDVGTFGPFDSRDDAFAFARTLCTDPGVTYGYEAWPMTEPSSVVSETTPNQKENP